MSTSLLSNNTITNSASYSSESHNNNNNTNNNSSLSWGTYAKVLPTSVGFNLSKHHYKYKSESQSLDSLSKSQHFEQQNHSSKNNSINNLSTLNSTFSLSEGAHPSTGLRLGLLGSLSQEYLELRKQGYHQSTSTSIQNSNKATDISNKGNDLSYLTDKPQTSNLSSLTTTATTVIIDAVANNTIRSSINNNSNKEFVSLNSTATTPNSFSTTSSKDSTEKNKNEENMGGSAILDNSINNNSKQASSSKTTELSWGRKSSESQKGKNAKAEEEAKMLGEIAKLNSLSIRFTKFKTLLDSTTIDLDQLKKLSWSGIPEEVRSTTWKLLMGYLPLNTERREATITRKRKEYEDYVNQSFGKGEKAIDQQLQHQIQIDVLRTHGNIPLYQQPIVRESLKKVLYCWAIRHPASGYVQGINDLLTPFFHVFLQTYVGSNVDNADLSNTTPETMLQVEADCFWCLTKLLDGIQDNYTFAQPGIQRQVARLKELIARIDAPLAKHLETQDVKFVQFAFRWMNCLLMREFSLKCTIRMWDTYMAEGQDGFSDFHVYVCAAFLVKWSDKLKKMEFADIMMFIQSLPNETQKWEEKDIELLLSEAFMWKSLFHNAPNHLVA